MRGRRQWQKAEIFVVPRMRERSMAMVGGWWAGGAGVVTTGRRIRYEVGILLGFPCRARWLRQGLREPVLAWHPCMAALLGHSASGLELCAASCSIALPVAAAREDATTASVLVTGCFGRRQRRVHLAIVTSIAGDVVMSNHRAILARH